jgi:hypothetical protein
MLDSFNTPPFRRILAGAALAFAAAVAWAQANVAGTWGMVVETPAGNGSPSFVLKQDGNQITGTYNGTFGSYPVTGSLDGDMLTLTYNASGTVITYKGKVTGSKVEGTVDLGGMGQGRFTGSRE